MPRRALAGAAMLVATLTSCSAGASPAARPTPGCELRLPAAPAPAVAPTAVLRDVAAGPTEYLLGSPGGTVVRLDVATGFSPPQLAGSTLFFSVRHGQAATVYRGTLGGCAHRITEGTLGSVEPRGRAMTVLVSSHWTLLDGEGRMLAPVTGAAGSWTSDGHLVEPAPRGIDVYDIAGKKRSIPLGGAAPLSALGSTQVLLSTATGLQVLDTVAGTHQPIGPASQLLRGATGSPDGARVAYLDEAGAGQVLDLQTLKVQPLPAPALTTGFAWSRDAAWIAVQTVYGGAALRLSDALIVATGAQVVVSW